MRENRLRTARVRFALRPPETAAATAGVHAARHSHSVVGTSPAEPSRLRPTSRVRGRLAGATSPATGNDPARLRPGQDQIARSRQTDREMVHAGCAEEPLRTSKRDDVRDDI